MSQSEKPYKEIGKRLDEFRRLMDFERKYIAKELGMTVFHYNNLARGDKLISNKHLIRIANRFPDLNINYVLSGNRSILISNIENEQDKEIVKLLGQIEVLKQVIKEQGK